MANLQTVRLIDGPLDGATQKTTPDRDVLTLVERHERKLHTYVRIDRTTRFGYVRTRKYDVSAK